MTNTKTIIAFSVVLAMVVGIASSISIVDAAKPGSESGEIYNKMVDLTPIGGQFINYATVVMGTAFIHHGDELCRIQIDSTTQLYIEFADTTTVKHQCATTGTQGNQYPIRLLTEQDEIFQAGDFIILGYKDGLMTEVYRSQTP
jgi:hypothetical protein